MISLLYHLLEVRSRQTGSFQVPTPGFVFLSVGANVHSETTFYFAFYVRSIGIAVRCNPDSGGVIDVRLEK